MNRIRQVQELNKRELESGVSISASWHNDYRDTAFIYVGGLPLDLSEGDVVTIFSQYGEPTFINLVRDRETGKSKGFCFLKYEDQRSTDLAVDNLSGAKVLGRLLSVDHTRYKKRDDEELVDNTNGAPASPRWKHNDSPDEDGDRPRRDMTATVEARPLLKEEQELAVLRRDHDDDDPMKAFLIKEKEAEVATAIENYERAGQSDKKRDGHRHRHHRRSSRHGRHDTERSSKPRHKKDDRSSRRRDSRSASLERGDESKGEGRHRKHHRDR